MGRKKKKKTPFQIFRSKVASFFSAIAGFLSLGPKFISSKSPTFKKVWPVLRWPVRIFGVLALLGVIAVWAFYFAVRFGAFGQVPTLSELRKVHNPNSSEVYSADGVLLGRYYIQNRTTVAYDDIADDVIEALVATEDARFYKHGGVDFKGLIRVLVKTVILRDEASGGGSTISQQLAKNLYGRKRIGKLTIPVAKVKEMIIAGRMEKLYSKREILTMYLNTVPFGEKAFGIETASRRYFSTSPAKLKTEEAAVLVGLLKATNDYNPRLYPERSLQRRNSVLDRMTQFGDLPESVRDSLKQLPLGLKYNYISQSDGLAPYFREHLRQELKKWAKENPKSDGTEWNIYTDGLKIHTTIDSRLQKYAEKAVEKHMTSLQKSFDSHWKGRTPWGNDLKWIEREVANSKRYRIGKENGLTQAQLNEDFRKKRKMTIFTWEGEKEVEMSPLDSIIHYLNFLNTGFLAMDPGNGQIKAWVGGIDHHYFKYDHTRAKRQVGSTFKPIVYATALDRGATPCDYYPNEQIEYTEYDNWAPANSDGEYGGEYSMVGGLANSVNTIAVQVIMETGVKNVVRMAEKMGITDSHVPAFPSIALGTPEVTLYEMIQVYGTLANKGYHVKPVYISKIEDRKGRIIEQFETRYPEKKQVLAPEDASLMVEMMKRVVDEGTGQRLRYRYNLQNDIAGKTGTTQSHADGWFMGITPKLVAGSWVGGANNHIRFRSISLGQGANMALPIWAEFFVQLNKDKNFDRIEAARFAEPDTLVQRLLDCALFNDPGGYLPADSLKITEENVFVITREGKPDIIINKKPKKKKNKKKKEGEETKKLRDKLRELFKKKQ